MADEKIYFYPIIIVTHTAWNVYANIKTVMRQVIGMQIDKTVLF